MVHPRHREPLGAAAASFFVEDLSVIPAQEPKAVQWEDGCRTKRNDVGSAITTWKGKVAAVPHGSAYVTRIDRGDQRRRSYRWFVLCPNRLCFDGFAVSRDEAFGMVERAAAALPCWLQRIREIREMRATPEEERVLKAVELLVGVRPLRGAREWVLREEDIPEERKEDWARHGHTICNMLRDLSR
jgi:hypothetical protein